MESAYRLAAIFMMLLKSDEPLLRQPGFDPLPRMAAIYGMAELCGVGHRKVGPWEIPWGPEISMGKMRSPCIFQRQDETFQHV